MLEDLLLIVKIAFSWYALLSYVLFGLFLLLLKRIAAEPRTLDYTRPPAPTRKAEPVEDDALPDEGEE